MTRCGVVQAKLIGGLGNQMHQYAAVRKYAELHNATLEAPDWIGRRLFGLNDPFWSCELPEVNDGGSSDAAHAVRWGDVNVRLGGYFQFQCWVGLYSRQELKRWFAIQPQWLDACPAISIGSGSRWYPAAHLRRGDYIGHPLYANVHESAYMQACEKYGIATNRLVWVDQACPLRLSAFDQAGLYDIPDFITLVRAQVILRANSTFSWWAAVLAADDVVVYSPVVENRTGPQDAVPFVLGNWPRCADTRTVGVQVTDLHLAD